MSEPIYLDFSDMADLEARAGLAAEALAEVSEEDKQKVRRMVAKYTRTISEEFKFLDMLGLM